MRRFHREPPRRGHRRYVEPLMEVRGRYAPSPTGRLHLGNARTALLAWLHIRALRGTFVMRIEDLDEGRSRAAFAQGMLEDLRWLGIDWDEGPDVGGPWAPYRQSERDMGYRAALGRLATYPCACTRRELRAASLAPHGAEPVYPGTCRGRVFPAERPLARRFWVPPGEVTFTDACAGPQTQDVAQAVGDFIVQRSDGGWAYQLAVVVDDAAMRITHVVRGMDLLDSTPRQILLQRALDLPTPVYAHVPLVYGPDGEKLSKRHGAPDLAALRSENVDPRRVVGALAHSVGLVRDPAARVSPAELVADFELAALRPVPSVEWQAERWR